MKRVLVISYYWPPSGGSGVQRWVKMCKYLPSEGWRPVVYTPENPALTSFDATLAADIPPMVEVVTRPILEPGQFAKKTVNAQVNPINSQKKSFAQRVAMWIRGNCFIPDPRVLWVRPSVRFLLKYLEDHPVDAIVSTGPPHSMHLIARKVALKTGLPWVADFRDPWTKMFYFKHLALTPFAERRHFALEKKVLDDATVIVAVSPLVRDDFVAATSTPVELVTNGFDASDFPDAAGVQKDLAAARTSERFTLLHAGLFASDGNPKALWQALSQLCTENGDFARDFRLVLCGKTDAEVLYSIDDAELMDNCINLGYVDHTDVVARMKSASVLMLPLRREPEYRATVPGKLWEYMASGRPVIGIGQKDGAMARILSDCWSSPSPLASATFDWDEVSAMKEWMSKAYELWKEGALPSNGVDLSAYTREALAGSYARLLDKITRK